MIERRELQQRLALLDEEREQTRATLAAYDQAVAQLSAQLERARGPEEAYNEQRQRLTIELTILMARTGASIVDSGGGHCSVVAGRIAVSRDDERELIRLSRSIRQLDDDRQEYLRNGGAPVATAAHRLERARIDRAVVSQRLAELEGG